MYEARLRQTLPAVRERLERARERADGRPVRLVAVTKGHPPDAVVAAWRAGLAACGENRVGELAGSKPVATPRTLQALDDAIAHLNQSVLPDKPTVGVLNSLKSNLEGRQLSYDELRQAQSALGSEISSYYKGKNSLVGARGVGSDRYG